MQLIYVHGFNSGTGSVKGQLLQQYCQKHHPHIQVRRPDLNLAPHHAMSVLGELIDQDTQTALVGSSLGGFYASLCVAKYNLRAVLINPSTRPFDSLQRLHTLAQTQPPEPHRESDTIFTTEGGWHVKPQDFTDLKALYKATPEHGKNILVLLQTGDDVLDYREAKAYYSQPNQHSQMIIESGGDHYMSDFDKKIPLVLQFLFHL